MKTKEIKNMSASVRARLLNLARSTGRDFQELVIRYSVERFLTRLSRSSFAEQFVLKGAMLYIPWKLNEKRTTMDLDLLGYGSPDLKHLKNVFQQICTIAVEDDGLIFNKDTICIKPIREEAIYDGVRVVIRVFLGDMPVKLQVDVGFGDAVVPAPQKAEFPALLFENGPVISSYSPETVIAEKFNAMVILGMANSRMKDYYDIWMLSRNFTIHAFELKDAVKMTFIKRETVLPQTIPVAITDDFFTNKAKIKQWKGFLRKQKLLDSAPELKEIGEILRNFLLPIVEGIKKDKLLVEKWHPEKGWLEKQ